jgi:hypothetical protein
LQCLRQTGVMERFHPIGENDARNPGEHGCAGRGLGGTCFWRCNTMLLTL